MERHLNAKCNTHSDPWECTDYTLVRSTAWCDRTQRQQPCVGIPVRDGGTSFILITHCPFCGKYIEGSPSTEETVKKEKAERLKVFKP